MAETRKHTALLVVDMQKDFLDEDRPISLEGGKAIIPSVIKAVEVARELGILVVWVVREHDPQGRDVEVFRRNFYGPGKLSPATKGSVQTPNCIRQTAFDAVSLDYQSVTVIVDATRCCHT
ncbi:putative inactive nicotinamidase [Vitis vinifera]|uniref:Putative inactive nicotinamidase n=1 Tax=Vitis vinifera TaxID=29760 RepID=A0A438GKY9_VITVI|nr:putative inactive nicotinamidase [Vitis vinifera]